MGYDLQIEGRTDDYVAVVHLQSWEPLDIQLGGNITIRRACGRSRPILLRGKWSEAAGIHETDRAVAVTDDLSEAKLAELEIILHDLALEEIAASRIAETHGMSRYDAYCVMRALFGDAITVDELTELGRKPQHLMSWSDDDGPDLAGHAGWVFYFEDRNQAVSCFEGAIYHHDRVATRPQALAMAAGRLRCQCGEVTQQPCHRFRYRSELVVVEWVPYAVRSSYDNAATYPTNGALRLLCCSECTTLLLKNEDGWAHLCRKES